MTEAGFNPLAEISETTGESMASLYNRISKGTLAVDEITASMVRATSEGGKYFQSMEKQSQTLNGQLSTLKDNAMSLLGDVMTPFSEKLRDSLLPMANDMIEEFAAAFEEDGFDGMLDAIIDKVPDLLNAAVAAGNKVISGLAKWMPGAMHQIASVLPNALRSVLDMGPQLVSALFDVVSGLVRDLVSMLPELVPMIIEGIGNIVPAIFDGIGDVLTGLFDGIDQAFHQGMTKIAGVWVDNEGIEAINVGLEADIDVSNAEDDITSAYATVRAALQTDLLTDDQRQQIVDMIGQDYDTIMAALLSFGLTEEEAEPIAEAISGVGEDIAAAWDGVAVGADGATIAKWVIQSEGSRLALRAALQNAGLSQDDITAILGQFDATASQLGNGTPDLFTRIYDALTDGLPDTPGQTDAFVGEANAYYDGMLNQIDADLEASIAALDPDSPDYAETVAELTAGADAAKAEAENLRAETVNFITNMSGKTTAEVEAAFSDLEELERRTAAVRGELDAANAEANTAAENAFKVVRSGANADEETIGLAINVKATEFKLDEQSAQDAYEAAVEELNAQLANNEITEAEYDEQRLSAEATRNAAVAQAKAEFEQAFAEILQGIAESEGNEAALQAAMEAVNAKGLVSDFITNMFTDTGEIDTEAAARVSEALSGVLGDAFNAENFMNLVEDGNQEDIVYFLEDMVAMIEGTSSDAMSTALGGKLGEAYASALEGGFLTGTSFDTANQEEQLAALLGAVGDAGVEGFSSSLENGAAAADSGASAMAQGAVDGAEDTLQTGSPSKKFYQIGQWAGQGLANGLNSKYSAVYLAARRLAIAAERGASITLQISSPSKVFEKLGMFTGEGFVVGYEKSIREAQRTVRGLTSGLVSAAALPAQRMTIAQSAQAAGVDGDDLSRLNVGLYISDRKIAEATADANGRVSNARAKRLAAGWGHV